MVDVQALATSIGINVGTGAVIGGIIGFAAKKLAKVIAVIIGLELALFKFLESIEILRVNWEKLGAGFLQAGEAAASQAPPEWLMAILSTLSIGGGFAAGFLLGFRRG